METTNIKLHTPSNFAKEKNGCAIHSSLQYVYFYIVAMELLVYQEH